MERSLHLRRGLILEALTVAWNIGEGTVSVIAGSMAGSIALTSFGIDSFIETASGLVVWLRLHSELYRRSGEEAERIERVASRLASGLLFALAIYILVESLLKLAGSSARPAESRLGIALTALALVVMPILSRAKLRCADALDSAAMRADAYETTACAWLSAATLTGLVANAMLGWWWADPVAAMALIPLILREALGTLREASGPD